MTRTLIFQKDRCTLCFEFGEIDPQVAIAYDICNPTDFRAVTVQNGDDGWGDYVYYDSKVCFIDEADAVILTPNGIVFEINNKPYSK